MTREIDMMAHIQAEKEKEIERELEGDSLSLNAENNVLAAGKRFTFDIIDTPVDPLR